MTDTEAAVAPTRHCSFGLIGCILVLLLAFALRLHQVHLDSLWEDEIFTAIQALLPVRDLLRWTAGESIPRDTTCWWVMWPVGEDGISCFHQP